MTTRTQRIEVITRGERRRRRPIEEKREIVAESLRSGIRPSEVIRKYGSSSGQLYAWRRQLTRRLGGELSGLSANFARGNVVVAEQQEKVSLEVASLSGHSLRSGFLPSAAESGANIFKMAEVSRHLARHAARISQAGRSVQGARWGGVPVKSPIGDRKCSTCSWPSWSPAGRRPHLAALRRPSPSSPLLGLLNHMHKLASAAPATLAISAPAMAPPVYFHQAPPPAGDQPSGSDEG
jgi:transposase-like protein